LFFGVAAATVGSEHELIIDSWLMNVDNGQLAMSNEQLTMGNWQ
jgi:hypothetical protein